MRVLFVAMLVGLAGCGRDRAEPAPAGSAEPAREVTREAAVHYASAIELESQGRLVEGLEAVERSLALVPTRDAYMLGARMAYNSKENERASAWTEAVLTRDPVDAGALYNRGLLAQRADQYNDARTAYVTALRHDPTLADARYNLALLVWRHGAKDEARHHLARFVERFPGDPRGAELRSVMGR